MAVESLKTTARTVRIPDRRHRAFFPAMSLLLAVMVLIGFAPTYYLRPSVLPAIPFYLHLHGAALTLWFSLLIAQTLLISAGRRALHRRLGVSGAVLGGVIVTLTPFVVIWSVPSAVNTNTRPIELTTLIFFGDMIALVAFATLLTLAVRMRRQPEAHSRLMWLASIPIVAPALGRASINLTGAPIPGLIVQMALPLLLIGHDWAMMRRVHPATRWGAAIVLGTMIFSIAFASTETAQSIVRSLG